MTSSAAVKEGRERTARREMKDEKADGSLILKAVGCSR